MSSVCPSSFLLFAASVLPLYAQAHVEKPLPAVAELQRVAAANFDKSATERERYLCRERVIDIDTDKHGATKKTETSEREIFFVNGWSIQQTITREGKPLTGDEARKRDEAVRKAIEKAEKMRAKPGSGNGFNPRDVLKMAKLTNERRIEVAGRPTIVFDIVPVPDGGSMEERFVHAVEGTVSIDEATGRLQDLNVHGTRDVKVGGGLLANVHKGFAFHLVNAPMADGVWLNKLMEGKGDARVGLFLTRGGAFRQETESCKLTDIQTTQTIQTASKDGETVRGAAK